MVGDVTLWSKKPNGESAAKNGDLLVEQTDIQATAPSSDAQPVDGVAANCLGLKVPQSRFLTEKRIERINAARYEGPEIAGALHVIRDGDRVLEVGAGLGVVGGVVRLNSKVARVLSFEANPELIPVIRALHDLNGLSDMCEGIEVRNQVLVAGEDAPAALDFHIRSSFLGSSLINANDRPSRVVQVPTVPFEEVCVELDPNVLLMDIEGGELDLLRAMDLSGFRAIVIEFHPEAYGVAGMRVCKNILRDAGFERIEEKSSRIVWTCIHRDRG